MKKYILFLFVLALVIGFSNIDLLQARINNNDQVVATAQTNDNVAVKLNLSAIAAATSTILVDLSDTTNFKHGNSSGVLQVSQIRMAWSTDVVATTTLKFGVIASSSASGALADVYWFDEVSFSTYNSTGSGFNGRQEKVIDYGLSVMKLNISSALPTSFFTNDKNTSDSTFATTTKLSSPVGLTSAGSGSLPATGDLVMRIYDQKGTATTSVSVIYRVKEQ
mgnify:CR=1 FL=1